MQMRRMIANEMAKSGGQVRIVPVPPALRPSPEDIRKLDAEIAAQVRALADMEFRSKVYASGSYA